MGQASREKKARREKKWELMEQVVCLLEKSLEPNAHVERDQRLTNHRTAGTANTPHKRQCDVVIRRGPPERESVWIVEVQKRVRNVDQGDYDGWITKLDQVGAAGLICVAEKGFPQSVIDDAKTRGPRIKLLTLSELEGKDWPFTLGDKTMWFSKLDITIKTATFALIVKRMPLEPVKDAPIGSRILRRVDTGALITAQWLSQIESQKHRDAIDKLQDGEYPGHQWTFKSTPFLPVELQHGSEWLPVEAIDFTVNLTLKRYCLPLTCSKYEPVDFGGILAYALTAGGKIDGKEVNSRIILRPTKEGGLKYITHEVTGFPNYQIGLKVSTETPGPMAPANSSTT
ncbi:MAG TPA: hypothetical protein VF950_21540 [Planctomycetota bacterium]